MNTQNISFSVPSSPVPQIAREDFVQAGLCLLAADDASKMVRGYAKNPKAIGSAFLFQELRAGKGGEYFASLRQSVYDAARDAGYTVNTRSNTVGVLTSNAATVADSPHRDAVLRAASNFAQAVKLAKEAKQAEASAKQAEETEREASALLATMTADEREAVALDRLIGFVESIADTYGLDDAGIIAIMKRATPKRKSV
jgi:hypothetical protein